MKKILSIISSLLLIFVLVSCSNTRKLYVINVGDYINDELVSRFEKTYNCEVIYTETNSNEEIYQKLKNEDYDICVVSDYLIDRLYQENLIQKLDFSKIDNYEIEKIGNEYKLNSLFNSDDFDGVCDAEGFLNSVCKDSYIEYCIPYFWGTVGILYNTNATDDLESFEDEIHLKGLSILFENNNYNKGMYNSSRDALCMALIAYNKINNTNIDINTSSYDELKLACNLINNTTYRAWGDDNLKAMIRSGMLDLALVYSGDYMDELYQCEADGLSSDEINFNYYAPDDTNIWFDGMVLTSNSKNTDLAYKFLNFFQDPEVCAENADYIGYFPMNKKAFNILCTEYVDYYDVTYDESLNKITLNEELDENDPYFVLIKNRNKYAYKFVSVDHYNWLNDLLDEAKSK